MSDSNTSSGMNYQSNSNKKKIEAADEETPERPKLAPVAEGTVRKPGLGKRISEAFTGDDSHTVANVVLFDVILPAVKTMISDAVSQGIERLLFGEGSRGTRTRTGTSAGGRVYTSYNKVTPGEDRREPRNSSATRLSRKYDEISFPTRDAGEAVIDALVQLIDTYGEANLADFYELVGVTEDYVDNKWGWRDLRGARVIRVRNEYVLDLPRIRELT